MTTAASATLIQSGLQMTLGSAGNHAVALVRVPAPWYAPNRMITSRFRSSIGDYEQLPGLERKLYILTEEHQFGGIYLWSTKQVAESFHSERWAADIRKRRGVDPKLSIWDAPYIVEGQAKPDTQALSERSVTFPLTATVTLFTTGHLRVAANSLADLAAIHGIPDGLVRSYLLAGNEGQIGIVDVWTARSAADSFFTADWLKLAGAEIGTVKRDTFEAPVSMNPAKNPAS
jgi:hypothetical protein